MAKSLASPYLVGKRSRYWLKIKPRQCARCWIIGYTAGQGNRKSLLGAIAVAEVELGQWVYRGKVGSGFNGQEISTLLAKLKQLKTESPPVAALKQLKGIQWVRPEMQCEVVFQEYTAGGHFRAPVFKGLIQ